MNTLYNNTLYTKKTSASKVRGVLDANYLNREMDGEEVWKGIASRLKKKLR